MPVSNWFARATLLILSATIPTHAAPSSSNVVENLVYRSPLVGVDIGLDRSHPPHHVIRRAEAENPAGVKFLHGVASGDPWKDSV
ncbi:hypothetical protein HK104_005157, partial [Borealophlyctis nickersoniae]